MFSSKTDQWATPQAFYDELNKEFNFTLNPCADETNHKCNKYFTKEVDGLAQDWANNTVFCNPPYGRAIKDWVKKCYEESLKPHTKVVMLIPARTDTAYFHNYIYGKAEIRFIRGRLKFGDSKNSAPFPSMVVIFRNVNVNCGSCIYFNTDNSNFKCIGECTNEFRQTHYPALYNNTRKNTGRACLFYREVEEG